MAAQDAAADTRKRKRSQKTKEGPTTRHKRPRADGAEIEEDDADNSELLDAVPTSAQKTGSKRSSLVGSVQSPKAGKDSKKTDKEVQADDQQLEKSARRRRRHKHNRENAALGKSVRPEWRLSKPLGGRFIRHDPIFTGDGKYMFAATARELRICSMEDSLVDGSISVSDGTVITSFVLSGANPSHLYICTSGGNVEQWNWMTRTKVDSLLVDQGHITSIVVHTDMETEDDSIYLVTILDGIWYIVQGDKKIYTSMMPLTCLRLVGDYILATAPGRLVMGYSLGEENYRFTEFRIGANVSSLAARVQVSQASQKKAKAKKPQDTLILALGTASGEIFLYENVSAKDDSAAPVLPEPTTLHWHRENVEALQWSQDGNYLISGGRETVLVLWQLATGKRQYLPHLTAEIEHITVSPSGAAYAIQLADNSVMVLSTSELKPIANFAGIQAQHPSPDSMLMQSTKSQGLEGVDLPVMREKSLRLAATLHPQRTEELILTVPPSMLHETSKTKVGPRPFLQTYDLSLDRHVSRQAMSRNKITDFTTGPEGNTILEPDVPLIKISHDGQWLAVVEAWKPPPQDSTFLASSEQINEEQRRLRREVYLKFWHWSESKQQWALETRIDNPHSYGSEATPGRILDLAVDPSDLGFSTVGEDGCVKVWIPRQGGTSDAAQVEDWHCRHVVQLESNWELNEQLLPSPPSESSSGTVTYSPDGSLIAASQNIRPTTRLAPPVHFINTSTGALLQTLSGLYTGSLSSLRFLNNHLILLSTTSLTAYDVVASTLTQRIELGKLDITLPLPNRPRLLAIDSSDSTIAVAVPAKHEGSDGVSRPYTRIHVYDSGKGTKPVYTKVLPQIVTALLTVEGKKGYTILTSDAEVVTLTPPTLALPASAPATSAVVIESPMDVEEMQESGVEDEVMAELTLDDEPDAERAVVRPEELARVFETGATGAMPVRTMFEAVVGLFGRKVTATVPQLAV